MDFCIIPPNKHLELMNEGSRFFCLAQNYIKDHSYRDFFKHKVAQGKFVILDNGTGDFDLVSEDALINVVKDLMPSEVIPPDVLFNSIATVRNLESFINRMEQERLLGKVKVFGCPQGATREEWLWVYKYMLYHPHVDVLGFSKIAVPYAFLGLKDDEGIMPARNLAYDILKGQGLIQKPIHLLGMGSPLEMVHYLNDPLMRSTDSCNSVWSAMNQIKWNEGNFIRIKTPKDYFERQLTEQQEALALNNIFWFESLLNPQNKL